MDGRRKISASAAPNKATPTGPTEATRRGYPPHPMSTAASPTQLRKTPFHQHHLDHGAHMVDYAGWHMPLRYGSVIDEHLHCRASGGFFDVSHMGRIRFSGRHARRFLDLVCTRQVLGMTKGQCRYSLVCNEAGGCLDDVIVYCFDDDEYLMVCNAANREKLLRHFAERKGELVFRMEDETLSTGMAAFQGPKVMDIIATMSREIPNLKRYRFAEKNLLILKMVVSRTGYTGEDGVEIILGATVARYAIQMLLKEKGENAGVVKPVGLAARDTLRMEAGMPLYGHEIDEGVDPISAGLSFAVKLDKGDDDERAGRFIGQDALRKIAAEGPKRTLVGLRLEGRRSPRQGMKVLVDGRPEGAVTSGCLSPTLGYPIAMAYLPAGAAAASLEIDFGSERLPATVVPLPFYRRPE